MRQGWIVLLAALAVAAAAPLPSAHAAAGDPIVILEPRPPENGPAVSTPPTGSLEGPCGLALDSSARLYVSDYHHNAIQIYADPYVLPAVPPGLPQPAYVTQIANVDPVDGPCGVALDSSNRVYVNNFHRNVVRYEALPNFGSAVELVEEDDEGNRPTGVAVNSGDEVLVDMRRYVHVIDSSGAEVAPIGKGSLEDGYGVAVSSFSATESYVYVPDAATNSIKVYDPATDRDTPVEEINGSETPLGAFVSLRDSSIAIDDSSGEIYVVDDLTPEYKEGHEAVVYVFGADGKYQGRLKFSVQSAQPVGLAVDNSGGITQGRVFVTSGYSEMAAVLVYAPDSEGTAAVALSPTTPGVVPGTGATFNTKPTLGLSSTASGAAVDAVDPTSQASQRTGRKRIRGVSGRPGTATVQKGNVRVKVSGQLAPKRLPRRGVAPISVSVGGDISTTDQSPPPRLLTLSIALNRNGRIDSAGLPVCPYDSLQPASSRRALTACRSALVGRGKFAAEIALPGQPAYLTEGEMLAFNGRKGGKPVLFGHIYSPRPFANSFVIVFEIKSHKGGTFGTELAARLPRSLGNWGKLTGIELNLDRRYTYRGQRHSYVSASCPAPAGFYSAVPFSLARTSFGFEGGRTLGGTLDGTCTPRR